MTRLLDVLMRNPRNTERGRQLKESLTGLVPFIVDNVAAYCADQPGATLTWDDFPNLAPPFSRFWMEYKGWHPIRGNTQVGAAIYAARIPEMRDELLKEAAQSGEKFVDHLRGFLDHTEATSAHWLLNIVAWERRSYADPVLLDSHPTVCTSRQMILIKADGTRAIEEIAIEMFDLPEDADQEERHEQALAMIGRNGPFLLAMSFLHCKNVTQAEIKAPRQERRRREREGLLPTVTYKTLVIEPMTKVLHTEGGRAAGNSIARAMHICRGHFKHFDEKPLFGKHRGMFFWGDQVRNTESNRAVAKRYDVHPAALIVAAASGTTSPLRPESKSA